MNLSRKSADWLEERYGISRVIKLARKKTVPLHKYSLWYFTGGTALFLFCVQFLTGIVLLLYYKPTAESAHQSVADIMTEVPMGWLIRSTHHYAAQFLIAVVFIHFFSNLLLKAYRKPRELTWVTGLVLLGIVITFCFSGYLLPWDNLSFTAAKVGTNLLNVIPFFGFLTVLARGGEVVSGDTLNRFFALHVCVLPLALLVVAGLHLTMIQVQGMSIPVSVENDPEQRKKIVHLPFFPNITLRDSVIWLLVIGVIVTIAVLRPTSLRPEAQPFAPTPENTKPEWFLLFIFQFIKLFPAKVLFLSGELVAVLLISIVALFVLLIPFLDRRSANNQRSPAFTAFGIIAVVAYVVLTIVGIMT